MTLGQTLEKQKKIKMFCCYKEIFCKNLNTVKNPVDEEVIQKLHEEKRRQHCDFNLDSEGHLLWLLASLIHSGAIATSFQKVEI